MKKQSSLASFFGKKSGASEKKQPAPKRKREESEEEKKPEINNATEKSEDKLETMKKKRRLNVINDEEDEKPAETSTTPSASTEAESISQEASAEKSERKAPSPKPSPSKSEKPKPAPKAAATSPKKKAAKAKEEKAEEEEDDEVEEEQDSGKKYESEDEQSDDEIEDADAEEEEEAAETSTTKASASGSKKKGAPSYNYGSYDPKSVKWTGNTPYLHLAKTLLDISNNSGRIKKTEVLCNCFRSIIELAPQDLVPAVYLSTNRLAPAHLGIELGVGESLIIKAIAEVTSKNKASVKELAVKEGDLGTVAQQLKSNLRTMFAPKPLTLAAVYKEFKEIATTSGKSSQGKKVDKIKKLLVSAKECESQFIVRSLQGKLRVGLGEETVIVALAHAALISKSKKIPPSSQLKEAEETVKKVYNEMPSYDDIIPVLLKDGYEKLHSKCHLTVGLPCVPMLAKPSKEYSEVFERFGQNPFTCEWKYDGERAQIHVMKNKSISIYSRNLENHTSKYPDIIALIPKIIQENVQDCIIDGEVVAFDKETKKIKPFQVLSTRGRKNIKIENIKVTVCIYAFDILYLNGKSLLDETLEKRRELLRTAFTEIPGEFQFAQYINTAESEVLQQAIKLSVEGNCEGLIVKELNSVYEPSKRSLHWLKVKKDYLSGLGDSFDLVVIGGYKGTGKRTGVYGGFLLACYDPDNDEYQSITKIGTGFSDEFLQTSTKALNAHKIEKPKAYYRYDESHKPDVWFEPVQVWEILAADLTVSPAYKAAIGHVEDSKGIALRFPRFIRIRDDKKPEQATSAEQVAETFFNQANQKK